MAEIWLIRHGESLSNAGYVTPDNANVELSEKGSEQARALSSLFDREPDLIVMTPFLRTQLTARPTVERFPHVRQEIWPLHEFHCLATERYATSTVKERGPFDRAYWNRSDPYFIDGPGAESFADAVARVRSSLEIMQRRSEKFIAVFTHGRIMKIVRAILARPDLDVQGIMSVVSASVAHTEIKNCTIVRMTAGEDGVHLQAEEHRAFEKEITRVEAMLRTHSKIDIPAG